MEGVGGNAEVFGTMAEVNVMNEPSSSKVISTIA